MINPSEENLLGYLIRANEEHEQEELADQIRTDAKLRKDCQILQSGLALPAADEEHLDPPSLLAERTCEKLWSLVDSGEFPKLPSLATKTAPESSIEAAIVATQPTVPLASPATASLSVGKRTPGGHDNALAVPKRRWHWLDLAVASSVLVIIGGVLSTQVLSSRTHSGRIGCQNNLQLSYAGLSNYASMNGGRIPTAHERGPLAFAGMLGMSLLDSGHVKSDQTLICPETSRAMDPAPRFPKINDLHEADPENLPQLQKRAGGTYFYPLGYFENGKYHTLKLRNRLTFVLMSDPVTVDRRPGLNHGPAGQNILIENGCVRFLTVCHLEGCRDRCCYENEAGQAAAGLNEDDSVVVGSGVGPLR